MGEACRTATVQDRDTHNRHDQPDRCLTIERIGRKTGGWATAPDCRERLTVGAEVTRIIERENRKAGLENWRRHAQPEHLTRRFNAYDRPAPVRRGVAGKAMVSNGGQDLYRLFIRPSLLVVLLLKPANLAPPLPRGGVISASKE